MKRALLLAALIGVVSIAGAQNPKLAAFVGKPLPKFTMTTTKGQKLNNANLKGKVVLLDFWATWCGPCKAASPSMQKLHTNYGTKGLQVIGADCFEQGAKGTAAPYAKEHGYTYTFSENNDPLAIALGIEGIPAFVLIDKKGVVRKTYTGVPAGGPDALYKLIEADVKKLLK